MLAVKPEAIAAVPNADQAEADIVALQSIDLRILDYFGDADAEDPWRTCDQVATGLRVVRQTIAWRPLGRLQALELVEVNDRIPLTAGRRMFRLTKRGRAAVKLVRNPSAASEEVQRHVKFVAPPEPEPVVA